MTWRFFINDIEIDYPQGWDELVINIIRDEQWKGIFFEASTSTLGFYGTGFDILKDLKIGQGLKAVAIFRAEVMCEGESEFEEALRGKLNMAQYRETCGTECIIRMPVEQDDCTMILRNRYDQKVNIDSNVAFNKQTILENYEALGFTMELAPQEIPVSAEANVQDDEPFVYDWAFVLGTGNKMLVRPIYSQEIDASITTSQLANPPFFFQVEPGDFAMSPQVLLDGGISCFPGTYDFSTRLKGRFRIEPVPDSDTTVINGYVRIGYWDASVGNINDDLVVWHEETIIIGADDNVWYDFDVSFADNLSIPDEVGIYAYLYITAAAVTGIQKRLTVEFDDETFFDLSTTRICPATEVQAYGIHETFSRAVEAITDRCLTVKSDYYGRTDSQPYASSQDGCGGLRILTNGLKIRKAENNNLFLSVKDIFEGLNPIDNIGIGIEGSQVRVEAEEYFYNNTLIYTIDAAPDSDLEIIESRAKSIIKVGYKKWETESVKGLDEFNSNKEFRTGITAVNNTLDITSNFIAAGYVIEQIRTQQFISTGRADNKYDNDTFIICVDRQDGYIPFIVEQGNIANSSNIFSPSTAYNWRIRPIYNLMRWGKSLFAAYANINETDSKLFFTSGTGNYVASGELTDGCKQEAGVIAENSDISVSSYANPITPILTLDNVTLEYPLSVKDYKIIKANPYGFINLQCGGGDYIKMYIQNIEYKFSNGMATFNLAVKWP